MHFFNTLVSIKQLKEIENCGYWRKSDERFEFSGSTLVKIYLCYLKYQFIKQLYSRFY